VVVALGVTACVPEVARVPDQPSEAVQEVALVDDHVMVTDCPAAIVSGTAENEIVGMAGTGRGVVTSTGADCAEAFPAASSAATVKAYSSPPDIPFTVAEVPAGDATSTASR
jgi:hypothetical protein